LSEQPEDLPLAAGHRIVGLAVALFQLVKLQMRSQSSSSHSSSIHPDLV
jgi:hypothetical protein